MSIGAYGLLIVHDFSNYIDRYPYLAVDDALVNVAFAMAKEGRYGFLASPMQAPGDWLRHHGFFNYGPWYFYFGAFLIWLFGYSLALVRSIHLLVLVAIIVVCAGRLENSQDPVPRHDVIDHGKIARLEYIERQCGARQQNCAS